MKGRSTTLEALSCISEMQPGSIALNVKFIRETAQDAYGHLKEFGKIKAENSRLRTTVRLQKKRIANLEAGLEDMTSRFNIADHNAKKKGEKNAALQAELDRVRCERDAAVVDLAIVGDCSFCKHEKIPQRKEPCKHCYIYGRCSFEWRGPCEDNGGVPADDH